nr:uncharacterized protein LOC131276579 [Dasypus novemcinctus]
MGGAHPTAYTTSATHLPLSLNPPFSPSSSTPYPHPLNSASSCCLCSQGGFFHSKTETCICRPPLSTWISTQARGWRRGSAPRRGLWRGDRRFSGPSSGRAASEAGGREAGPTGNGKKPFPPRSWSPDESSRCPRRHAGCGALSQQPEETKTGWEVSIPKHWNVEIKGGWRYSQKHLCTENAVVKEPWTQRQENRHLLPTLHTSKRVTFMLPGSQGLAPDGLSTNVKLKLRPCL